MKQLKIGDRVKGIRSGSASWFSNESKFNQVDSEEIVTGTITDICGNMILIKLKGGQHIACHARMCIRIKKSKSVRITREQLAKAWDSTSIQALGFDKSTMSCAFAYLTEALGL